jgi:hypothetical protein
MHSQYFLALVSPFLGISTLLSCPSLAMPQHPGAGVAEPQHICAAEASYESTFHQRSTGARCAGEMMLFDQSAQLSKVGAKLTLSPPQIPRHKPQHSTPAPLGPDTICPPARSQRYSACIWAGSPLWHRRPKLSASSCPNACQVSPTRLELLASLHCFRRPTSHIIPCRHVAHAGKSTSV